MKWRVAFYKEILPEAVFIVLHRRVRLYGFHLLPTPVPHPDLSRVLGRPAVREPHRPTPQQSWLPTVILSFGIICIPDWLFAFMKQGNAGCEMALDVYIDHSPLRLAFLPSSAATHLTRTPDNSLLAHRVSASLLPLSYGQSSGEPLHNVALHD